MANTNPRKRPTLAGPVSQPVLEDAPQRATPERLAKAAMHWIGTDDKVQRLIAAPLDTLHARRALDPDPQRNAVLFEAGQRYLRHWHGSALSSLAQRDLLRPYGGQPDQSMAIPPSEAAAHHRSAYRLARERLGPYLAKWLDAIIIEERRPLEVGREATRYADKTTATAIAMEVLRASLTTLADHWGMLR
jgi:hypothetical protein